jgi:hypothetical protein
MATRQSTVRKLKSQPQLTHSEVQRIAEKLAVEMEHGEGVTLLMLLFSHLQTIADNNSCDLEIAFYEIKKHLFIGHPESDAAQKQFESAAFANRGKLLRWPNERNPS